MWYVSYELSYCLWKPQFLAVHVYSSLPTLSYNPLPLDFSFICSVRTTIFFCCAVKHAISNLGGGGGFLACSKKHWGYCILYRLPPRKIHVYRLQVHTCTKLNLSTHNWTTSIPRLKDRTLLPKLQPTAGFKHYSDNTELVLLWLYQMHHCIIAHNVGETFLYYEIHPPPISEGKNSY